MTERKIEDNLFKCRQCVGLISKHGITCPHCGCQNPIGSERNFYQFAVRYFASLFLVVGLLFFLATRYFTGVTLVLISIFIFEPSFKYLTNLFNWNLNKFWRIVIILLGFVAVFIIDRVESDIRSGRNKALPQIADESFACKLTLVKEKKLFLKVLYYLSESENCKNEKDLVNALSSIIKDNCPKCSISVFDDIKALEDDYKIMYQRVELGIDDCSYNKMRRDTYKSTYEHLLIDYVSDGYGNDDYKHDYRSGSKMYPYKVSEQDLKESTKTQNEYLKKYCHNSGMDL